MYENIYDKQQNHSSNMRIYKKHTCALLIFKYIYVYIYYLTLCLSVYYNKQYYVLIITYLNIHLMVIN